MNYGSASWRVLLHTLSSALSWAHLNVPAHSVSPALQTSEGVTFTKSLSLSDTARGSNSQSSKPRRADKARKASGPFWARSPSPVDAGGGGYGGSGPRGGCDSLAGGCGVRCAPTSPHAALSVTPAARGLRLDADSPVLPTPLAPTTAILTSRRPAAPRQHSAAAALPAAGYSAMVHMFWMRRIAAPAGAAPYGTGGGSRFGEPGRGRGGSAPRQRRNRKSQQRSARCLTVPRAQVPGWV